MGETNPLIPLGIIGIILVGVYFLSTGSLASVIGGSDLSATYDVVLSLEFPNWEDSLEDLCDEEDGTFKNEKGAVGCFDTDDSMDTSGCDDELTEFMEDLCEAQGATWDCDRHNVGCRY